MIDLNDLGVTMFRRIGKTMLILCFCSRVLTHFSLIAIRYTILTEVPAAGPHFFKSRGWVPVPK